MSSPLIAGFLTGLAVAAPVGPTGTEVIKRGLRGGFWPAFGTAMGAVTADLFYLSLVAYGVASVLTRFAGLRLILWVFGFAMLLFLGLSGLREALDREVTVEPRTQTAGFSYLVGLGITLTNPATIVLWLTVGGALISTYASRGSLAEIAPLLASVAAGVFGWFLTLSVALAYARRFVTPRILRIVSGACGLLLVVFAVKFGSEAVRAVAGMWN